jgi:NitT/TauT family transport system permease protein
VGPPQAPPIRPETASPPADPEAPVSSVHRPPAVVRRPPTPAARRAPEWFLSLALLVAFLAAWELFVRLRNLPPLVLPGPGLVARAVVEQLAEGTIWPHLWATLAEVVLGFGLGSAIGLTLGAAVAFSERLGRVIRPYIVASQAMPKLALAPIMVVWFGFDLTPKIVIAALISFFPLFENMVAGLQAVDPDQVELFLSLRANRWQTFVKLRLPSSVPFVVAGLRVALILSLVGAVVGEFVGANKGLGALIISAQGTMNTPLMFAVFVILTLLGIALSLLADVAERLVLRWRYGE